ncbi:MAG: hypothetical protein ACOYJZ_09375 [Acutalibacter sp.]|jgi:hypothetical protein
MSSLQFSYTLTEEEAYRGLRLSGVYKGLTGKRAVVETVLLVVFFLFFLGSYLVQRGTFDLAMAVICLILLGALTLVPHLEMKRRAKTNLRDVHIRMTRTKLWATTQAGEELFPLDDGSVTFRVVGKEKDGKLLTGVSPQDGLLILPVRAIPQENRGWVLSLLLGGQEE